jgi:hypothetical protein
MKCYTFLLIMYSCRILINKYNFVLLKSILGETENRLFINKLDNM